MIRFEPTRVPVFLALCLLALSVAAQEPAEVPGWFVDHIEFMTRDGGEWIASNDRYVSETEPFDAYGLIWQKGIGGLSMRGRMFALKDGIEVADLWEFRTVWDPGQKRVLALQFGGNGILGSGTMVAIGAGRHRLEQQFWSPDGSSFHSGHEDREEGDRHHTVSFDIGADGSWQENRSYVWQRRTD